MTERKWSHCVISVVVDSLASVSGDTPRDNFLTFVLPQFAHTGKLCKLSD